MDDNIWGFLDNKLGKMPEKVEKPKKKDKKLTTSVDDPKVDSILMQALREFKEETDQGLPDLTNNVLYPKIVKGKANG
jgi:hypothetical protein